MSEAWLPNILTFGEKGSDIPQQLSLVISGQIRHTQMVCSMVILLEFDDNVVFFGLLIFLVIALFFEISHFVHFRLADSTDFLLTLIDLVSFMARPSSDSLPSKSKDKYRSTML